MNSRIYLIGFMGSGKTTHGRRIARMMGYDFLDLDQWIEEQEGLRVAEIFAIKGESYFRECEVRAIEQSATLNNYVIATGGGTPCQNNNMELLNAAGLTVYLKLSPKALLSRLKASAKDRPLLAGKGEAEMLSTIESMLSEREPIYAQAKMTIDGLHQVDESVVNAIQRRR